MTAPRIAPSEDEITKGLRTVSMEDMRWLHCDIKSVSLLGTFYQNNTRLSVALMM